MTEYPLEYIDVDLLVPNDWNPNKMNDKGFDRLVDEISEHSVIETCSVVPIEHEGKTLYRIIGGEHRWRAAKAAGDPRVPCLLLIGDNWKSEDVQKFVTMRLNVLRGSLDPTKFIALYDDMVTRYGDDSVGKLMGYTDENLFRSVVNDIKKSVKSALPKEMGSSVDKALSKAKNMDDLTQIIQMLFHQYGDTLDLSYMVFTFGKREHIYVKMNPKLKKAVDQIVMYSRGEGKDMNDVLEPILLEFVKELKKKSKQKDKDNGNKPVESNGKSEPSESTPDESEFDESEFNDDSDSDNSEEEVNF